MEYDSSLEIDGEKGVPLSGEVPVKVQVYLAITHEQRAELVGLIAEELGDGDEKRCEQIFADLVADLLEKAGVKPQSLRMTAERWRRDIERAKNLEKESGRESQTV